MLAAAGEVPVDVFAQYGILGALVVGFLMGWISPGYLLKREQDENARLRSLIEDRVIPVAEASTAALERSGAALDKALTVLQEHEHQLESLPSGRPEGPPRRRT